MAQSDASVPEVDSGAGDTENWEKGEVRRGKDVSATLSFRSPARLAIEVEAFALAHQMTVSEVLRRAVERYLEAADVPTFSNTYFSVMGTTWNASLRTGGPTTIRPSGTESGGSETIPHPRMPLFERTTEHPTPAANS